MIKNYVQEVLKKISDVERINSELDEVKQQIDTTNSEYERQIRAYKEARDKKLKPLTQKKNKLDADSDKKRNEIVDIVTSKLCEYSYFDDDIFPYIVNLMSLVEGREYTFDICSITHVCTIGYYDKPFLKKSKYIKVLEVKSSFIFYLKIDFQNPVLVPTVDFGKYGYIKDYLDAMINYRIENNLRMPIDEEFERMALTVMRQYISDNLEFIKTKQNQRVTEKQVEMDAIYEMLVQGDIGARK